MSVLQMAIELIIKNWHIVLSGIIFSNAIGSGRFVGLLLHLKGFVGFND